MSGQKDEMKKLIGLWVTHNDGNVGCVVGKDPYRPGFFQVHYSDGVKSSQHGRLLFIDGVALATLCADPDYFERTLRSIRIKAEHADLFQELHHRLKLDYLAAEQFYETFCAAYISRDDYDGERVEFVKSWIAENQSHPIDSPLSLPDKEQLLAIATTSEHVQVIARAGSGKTSTLVHRTHFLLKHCGVASGQLLLLAFNRKAVLEIRRRLLSKLNNDAEAEVVNEIARRRKENGQKHRFAIDDIESSAVDTIAAKLNVSLPHVMTFHALAYSIVHPEESILFNGPEGESQNLSRAVQNIVDDHLQLPDFQHEIRDLMLAHFSEDWDRIVDGRYNQGMDELLKFRRSLPRETLGGEYVKSYGEKVIANYLFEHGIPYKYERNHWWNGVNYRPDFTLFKSDKSGVIIEYFGLQGDDDYDEMSADKQKYWEAKRDWALISIFPIDVAGIGLDAFRMQMQARLEACEMQRDKLTEDEIWQRVRERSIDRFTNAIVGFIARCRKLSWTPHDLQAHVEAHVTQSPVESMFLVLAQRLYSSYLDRLQATGEDDFDGLLQRAAENINGGNTLFQRKAGGGDLKALQYICIDEFQDFSDLFFKVLEAIRAQNRTVKLFCVGDDWQAINGFAGSDLRFFRDFPKYIGESRKLNISTNYRSSKSIVDIGNALMHGLGKPAIAHKDVDGRVLVSDLSLLEPTLLEKQRHPGDSITPAVLRVVNQALAGGHDVVMLSRRNGLPFFVNYEEGSGVGGQGIDRFLRHIRSYFPKDLQERITASTAHKYKGLEKSVVVVLDAVGRSYPLIHPDWVFSRIFGDSPEKITDEERRLLYVALTRAISTLVIFTQGQGKSPFLEDIERMLTLKMLNWIDFPPLAAITDARVVVQIKDQKQRPYNSGTFAVKDQLKAGGYKWQSVDHLWEKSFPKENFDMKSVRSEAWASSPDGVEVRVVDEAGIEVAAYRVDFGVWTSQFEIASDDDLDF